MIVRSNVTNHSNKYDYDYDDGDGYDGDGGDDWLVVETTRRRSDSQEAGTGWYELPQQTLLVRYL